MADTITSASEIPDTSVTPVYVLANDAFMSGWGGSQGKINTVILPCESLDEAKIVAENARSRSEMRRVRIVAYRKPRLDLRTHTYSLMNRTTASRWYTPGGFSRSDKE